MSETMRDQGPGARMASAPPQQSFQGGPQRRQAAPRRNGAMQTRRRVHHSSGTIGLAQGLGWFSLALGAAELLAPGALARAFGSRQGSVVAMFGAREVAAGLGILTSRDPTPWIYGRIAGDALDLAALATQLGRDNPHRSAALTALAAVAGVTALDLLCAAELAAENRRGPVVDYSDRSGLGQRRGTAEDDPTMAAGAI